MDPELALTLAATAVVAGIAGCIWNLVVVRRRSYDEIPDESVRNVLDRLRSAITDWPKVAAAVVLLSTFVPWISGSAVGVALPETLWELPWVRWPIGLAAIVVVGLA